MMIDSKWYALIKIINSCIIEDLKNSSFITRSYILRVLDEKGFDKTSVDTYRNYLSQAGYLKRSNFLGIYYEIGSYKIEKMIPENLTLRECKRQAYPNYYGRKED